MEAVEAHGYTVPHHGIARHIVLALVDSVDISTSSDSDAVCILV